VDPRGQRARELALAICVAAVAVVVADQLVDLGQRPEREQPEQARGLVVVAVEPVLVRRVGGVRSGSSQIRSPVEVLPIFSPAESSRSGACEPEQLGAAQLVLELAARGDVTVLIGTADLQLGSRKSFDS